MSAKPPGDFNAKTDPVETPPGDFDAKTDPVETPPGDFDAKTDPTDPIEPQDNNWADETGWKPGDEPNWNTSDNPLGRPVRNPYNRPAKIGAPGNAVTRPPNAPYVANFTANSILAEPKGNYISSQIPMNLGRLASRMDPIDDPPPQAQADAPKPAFQSYFAATTGLGASPNSYIQYEDRNLPKDQGIEGIHRAVRLEMADLLRRGYTGEGLVRELEDLAEMYENRIRGGYGDMYAYMYGEENRHMMPKALRSQAAHLRGADVRQARKDMQRRVLSPPAHMTREQWWRHKKITDRKPASYRKLSNRQADRDKGFKARGF